MNLSYLIPVYDTSILVNFIKSLQNCKTYKDNDCGKIIVCVKESDNIDDETKNYLSSIDNLILLKASGKFSFNDAFFYSLDYVQSDALVMLDTYLQNFPALLDKCIKKHASGAKIVFVKKKREKLKGFFVNFFQKIYNLFVSLYTGKIDKCNIISMGLIDKYMIDILKEIPHRRCALKNCDDFYKIKTSTIYVSPKTACEKTNFNAKTTAKQAFIISTSCFLVLLISTIVLNIFIHIVPVNIVLSLLITMTFFISLLTLPKHIYDCRNKNLIDVTFKEEKLA